jgi:hypothetical protein
MKLKIVQKAIKLLKHQDLSQSRFSRTNLITFATVFAVAGAYIIFHSFAAGFTAAFEAEKTTINSPAVAVSDSNASGGSALKFAAAGSSGACPTATHNIPDGPDPWGGCWPGPKTTGYPHGLAGDTRTPVTLTNYTGGSGSECVINTAVTLDSKRFNCTVIIQAKVTIKNSLINGGVIIDSDNAATSYNLNWFLTMQDSEVNFPAQQLPALYEGAISLTRVDVHGGETAVQCGDKAAQCTIHDSYLHGQDLPVGAQWHLGGFHSIGGTNYDLTHNYVVCDQPAAYAPDGGCTGDIAFIPTPPLLISHALITKNMLGPNTSSAYCLYGGDRPPDYLATNMTITNNVFNRGTNRLCAAYGPVAATNTGSTNVWSGNVWEDGGTILPEE